MVPGFILKLWKMVNDPQCNDLISWSDNGTSFIIIDPPRFSQELSKYFKHNNLSSFIRQLNMYGFRKVATIENSGLHPGVDDLHFYHPEFVRGHKDRLAGIKRKLPQKLAETIDLKNVYRGITEIEDRQKDVSKSLADLRRENEMLWQELHDLRQKHQQQQLYISRLMKLVYEAMEQNGIKANMLPLRHNPTLMIEGGEAVAQAPTSTPSPTSPNQEAATTTTITTSPNTLLTPNTSLVDDVGAFVHPVMDTTYQIEGVDGIVAADEIIGGDDVNMSGTSGVTIMSPPTSTPTPTTTTTTTTTTATAAANNHLHSQIESAEFQIDHLVPTISDFSEEDLNLFID